MRGRHNSPSRLVALLLAFGLLPGRGAESAKVEELSSYLGKLGYYSLQLKRERSRARVFLAVKTRLGGQNATLVIDTTTVWTTLDSYTAREWKTPDELGVALVDSAFGALTNVPATKARLVVMPELRLGEAVFLNQPVLASRVKSELWSPEGSLGCDFLVRNHCILDCKFNSLFVRQAASNEETRSALSKTLKLSGFRGVPLRVERGTGLACDILINGSKVSVSLASGSPITVLDSTVAKECGLSYMKDAWLYWTLYGSEVPVSKVHQLNLVTFGIGKWTMSSLSFSAGDLSPWDLGPKRKSPGKVDGLIGLPHLAALHAVIDFGAGELWIRPKPPSGQR